MPVYEYRCEKCDTKFEVLVRREDERIACPSCQARKVKKMFSVFGVGMPGTSGERPTPPAGGGGGCCGGGGCGCGH